MRTRKLLYISFQDGDTEPDRMYRSIVSNIIDSETNYVEWLSVLLKVSTFLHVNKLVFAEKKLSYSIFVPVYESNPSHYWYVTTNSE